MSKDNIGLGSYFCWKESLFTVGSHKQIVMQPHPGLMKLKAEGWG